MMNPKKRKLSGLSGLELRFAYERLLELKKTFVFEESEDAVTTDRDSGFEQQIETTLSLMKLRPEELGARYSSRSISPACSMQIWKSWTSVATAENGL
jgi:hypothetical protein